MRHEADREHMLSDPAESTSRGWDAGGPWSLAW